MLKQLTALILVAVVLLTFGCGGQTTISEGPPTIQFEGVELGDLESYSAFLRVTLEGTLDGVPAYITWEMRSIARRDPLLVQVDGMVTRGREEPTSREFRLLSTEDTVYTFAVSGGVPVECAESPGIPGSFEDVLVDPARFIHPDMFPELERVTPDEWVNGVLCQHYRRENYAGGEMVGATIDLWRAVEGGYTIKLTVEATGNFYGIEGGFGGKRSQAAGHVSLEFDMRELNPEVSAEIPEYCEAPPEEVPLPPDVPRP